MNQLLEKAVFDKIWLSGTVYVEVLKCKGESQIHIGHLNEIVD